MEVENIEEIVQKLGLMKIQKIISIDNEWNRKPNIDFNKDIVDVIDEMNPKNKEHLLRKVSNEGFLTIQDVYDAKDKELMDMIDLKMAEREQLPPALNKLNKILMELEKRGISVEKISEYDANIFKSYHESCLFILDKEMDDSKKDIIRESIPNIIEEADNNHLNHLIIVYSSNIGDEYKNNKNKIAYVKDYIQDERKGNLYIYKMFAIKKGEDTKLDKLLNQKLSDCIYGDALYHYMLAEKEKREYVYDRICEIDNEEIAKIADDNVIEGSNIKDSIEIIERAIKKSNENERTLKELDILEKFNFYQKNKIKNFNKKHSDLEINNQYKKYREQQDEAFINGIIESDLAKWENIDYSINKLYKDITTGDIFKLKLAREEKECYIMIIENACDCILRNQKNIKDVSRKAKDANIKVLLFERENISNIKEKELVRLLNSGEIIFPVKEENDIYCLRNTGKEMKISSLLLDLCTINPEGKCFSHYDEEIIKKYKNYYFEEYINKPEIKKYIKELQLFSNISEENWEKVLKPFEEKKNIISQVEIEHGMQGDLKLKRIGRLNYNITLRVCQKNYYKMEDDLLKEQQEPLKELHKNRKSIQPAMKKIVSIKKQK